MLTLKPGYKITQHYQSHKGELMAAAGRLLDELKHQRKHTTKRVDELGTVCYTLTEAMKDLVEVLDRSVIGITKTVESDERTTEEILKLFGAAMTGATMIDASERLNAATEERAEKTKWHQIGGSVMPEKSQIVLVKNENGDVRLARYVGKMSLSHVFLEQPSDMFKISRAEKWAEIPK